METEDSLPCSQDLATESCPESGESSQHLHMLLQDPF